MKLPIFLDNHSTTRVDPRVAEAMMPYFTEEYGNASSRQHEYGWRAEAAVELARRKVALLIGAEPDEICFTCGATESINLALKGVVEAHGAQGMRIITAATEHAAVLDVCRQLERWGVIVTVLDVDADGVVSPEDVARAIDPQTILVSIMAANNEIGTISPIDQIATLCRERGVLFHTDATQAIGKIPLNVRDVPVSLLSFSAHKMYGPKGVGALYIRSTSPRIRIEAQMSGGGHEKGLRAGTLNVPGIVGFGKAAEIAAEHMPEDALRTAEFRDRLVAGLVSQLEDLRLNGHPTRRLPNNANITFPGGDADTIMMEMKDIALSSGSACSSSSSQPSHVLRAIGLSDDAVRSTLRFGVGRFTTDEEIQYSVGRIVETVNSVRKKGLVKEESSVSTRRGDAQ